MRNLLQLFPLIFGNASLIENSQQQTPIYGARMRVRDSHTQSVLTHELVLTTGIWTVETERPEVADEVCTLDRTNGRHG